jgi:hypothetical protein
VCKQPDILEEFAALQTRSPTSAPVFHIIFLRFVNYMLFMLWVQHIPHPSLIMGTPKTVCILRPKRKEPKFPEKMGHCLLKLGPLLSIIVTIVRSVLPFVPVLPGYGVLWRRLHQLIGKEMTEMIETTPFQKFLTRFLLIGSFAAFAIGAASPAFGGVWTGTREEGAQWIVAHPGGWAFTTTAFIVSLVMCIAGLAIFSEYFLAGDAQFLGKTGFYVYLTGALLWIITMGFRLSVIPLGAEILVENGALPEYLTPLSQWETALFDIFNTAAFLASSIFGLALLKSRDFSNWLGGVAVAYGILGVIFSPIPIMVLVIPLILGVSPLPLSIKSGGQHKEI